MLQIWVFPPQKGLPRLYGSKRYTKEQRDNKLLNIVSGQDGNSDIKIYQDVNIYVSEFDKELEFEIKEDRQIYFVQIEGSSTVNGVALDFGDAMEITNEDKIVINPISKSHILFIEKNESDKILRLLQIWVFPPQKGLPQLYGSKRYTKEQRDNKLLNIVSSQDGDSDIKIYQDRIWENQI